MILNQIVVADQGNRIRIPSAFLKGLGFETEEDCVLIATLNTQAKTILLTAVSKSERDFVKKLKKSV